jgi:hypothetical protein
MKNSRKVWICALVIGVLYLISTAPVSASEKFRAEPVAAFSGADAAPWARVELLRDEHPGFVDEAYAPSGAHKDPLIVKWFAGKSTPPSSEVILHCAPGFNGKTLPTPILLIPGSCDNANRGYIHPWHYVNPSKMPDDQRGFALSLSQLGYSVFALTFSHMQGCNIMQAEHIANAIQRIRTLLKRDGDKNFKVDLIAHSKGNVAAWLYCSNSRAVFPQKTFLTPFRKDVRRYIAIASPFQGIDTPFRYYLYNLALAMKGNMNAPYGADSLLFYGMWKDVRADSVFRDSKNMYPGQAQLLFNLVRDGKEPLGLESYTTIDANYSMNVLYKGGKSLYLTSRGIDKAIEDGDRLIYRLNERGLDPSVAMGVVAGKNPALAFHTKDHKFIPMVHEIVSSPFDGLLFVSSATAVDGALKRGAKLLGMKVLHLNHVEVARDKGVLKLIDSWLMDRTKKE